MYFDGSLTLEGAGAGFLLISPNGDKLRYALQLHFRATNNIAEYEALLHSIRAAVELMLDASSYKETLSAPLRCRSYGVKPSKTSL
jgi:ribonuclease HI